MLFYKLIEVRIAIGYNSMGYVKQVQGKVGKSRYFRVLFSGFAETRLDLFEAASKKMDTVGIRSVVKAVETMRRRPTLVESDHRRNPISR